METTNYLAPGVMTDLGKWAGAVAGLPGDFRGIARVLQGLCIHEFWGKAYGLEEVARRETVHLRRAEDILDAIGEPLDGERAPAERTATNCRGFTVLAVAMLRAHGVPARARCGFGTYFTEGYFEDHWVVEYYDDGRWKRGDAQIDDVQARILNVDFDLADLPEGAFLTGGEAWKLFRSGGADPDRFGLTELPEFGDWWIAANLMRDVADKETLCWDVWGEMPEPDKEFDYAYFDRMADGREKVTVPDVVFSAARQKKETLIAAVSTN